MKKMFLFVLVIASFSANAISFPQWTSDTTIIDNSSDSGDINISIALTKDQHWFIIGTLPDKGTPDAINYLNQVSADEDTAGSKSLTVVTKCRFVVYVYRACAALPEGIADKPNAEMKEALLPQIVGPNPEEPLFPWLVRNILAIMADHERRRQEIILTGKAFTDSID
jgi:hypothetical protein